MKALILYRPNTEQAGIAEEYAASYKRLHQDRTIELVSLDTPEGADKAQIYGVTTYPALLTVAEDGRVVQMWQGGQLPLSSELDYYLTR